LLEREADAKSLGVYNWCCRHVFHQGNIVPLFVLLRYILPDTGTIKVCEPL
jgi:hypothetical protein